MEIKKIENGYILTNNIFYSHNEGLDGYINLYQNIAEDFVYGKSDIVKINYPGEYDISDIYIKCIQSNIKLNYYVKNDQNSFCIIQSESVLDKDEFQIADYILISNEIESSIKLKMEKNEIKSKLILLENIV
ncbi:hypothetical protein [Candidatus Vampirococcus lugosii]|uniref:Uncharacterized protein n=1 Tax=Candidatus Vampirococcus lugosii TaxID=2789015 RepID=A0ABS5QMA2_9BACT|nr:hypothetical protein [Candidatus Vampirococcus lugosii]MBS8122336.1 hypothetical protein [Candidatus Vampirococcus lugosii]